MEIDTDEKQDDYETEVIDGILTFDELLEDDYYKSEFEKRGSRGWKNITITQKEEKNKWK